VAKSQGSRRFLVRGWVGQRDLLGEGRPASGHDRARRRIDGAPIERLCRKPVRNGHQESRSNAGPAIGDQPTPKTLVFWMESDVGPPKSMPESGCQSAPVSARSRRFLIHCGCPRNRAFRLVRASLSRRRGGAGPQQQEFCRTGGYLGTLARSDQTEFAPRSRLRAESLAPRGGRGHPQYKRASSALQPGGRSRLPAGPSPVQALPVLLRHGTPRGGGGPGRQEILRKGWGWVARDLLPVRTGVPGCVRVNWAALSSAFRYGPRDWRNPPVQSFRRRCCSQNWAEARH
jgi:hypothetical protein